MVVAVGTSQLEVSFPVCRPKKRIVDEKKTNGGSTLAARVVAKITTVPRRSASIVEMCDLIDLKSPDGKTVGPKLASPLIPAPTKPLGDEKTDSNSPQASSGLNFVKRNSLDNNPFDNALHKTAEYVRKQDDPFEVVLEKALKYKEQNVVNTPKARSVEFKDDFTPKKTRYSDILKMNKTLDDSLIEAQLAASDIRTHEASPCPDDSIIHDLNNTNLLAETTEENVIGKFRLMNNRLVPRLCVEPPAADSSILNQSAMNDSLTDSGDSSEEFLIKSIVAQRISMCIQKGTDDANCLAVQEVPKSHKLRRSLSQGDRLSPRKFRQHRSQSIVDSLKASMGTENDGSVCSTASIVFDDDMNKAFLQSQCASGNVSAVSDFSNISAITRLASASSACNSSNSSSAFSNRTANCAFIESSSNLSEAKGLNDKINGRLFGMSRIHSTGSIAAIVESPPGDFRIKDDISDLLSKYSKLRVKSSEAAETPAVRLPSVISGSGILGRSASEKSEDKLIDVDVFVSKLEPSPSQEPQRQSDSSASSDSVFLDSTTVGRSILSEAKRLAKMFEESAGKTSGSSGSSITDDLLNSRPHWNFDLLPVSDDEALVDNLIELPNSPIKGDSPNVQNAEESLRNGNKSSSSSEPKSEKSMLKELETEFIAPEKKVYATTLLMDLEKLVKSEGNPEAVKLLENLERALGVKCESNADLLASCFAEKNNLTKSPRRSESALGTENIRNESNEKSCEDNADVESSESLKQLSLSEKSLRNNLNSQKEINKSEKSLVLVTEIIDNSVSPEKSSNLELHDSPEKIHDDSIAAIKQKNHITDDQKMAVEILVGLGKLLSGENKDPMTANLLKNLGMVLNLASSSADGVSENGEQKMNAKETKRVDTPVKKRVATPPRKPASLSAFSRSASSRRSVESSTKSKAAAERVMRRSISVTHTPTSTTPRAPSSAIAVDKSKAHLREAKKRFSSDPGVTSTMAEKKREIQAANNRRSSKDIALKPVGMSELARQEKPSSTVAEAVKTKLRKKTDSDGSNKRGPMKAFLPLGNMQRRGSIGKRVSPLTGSVTPPKPAREAPSDFTVTTSTPFPTVHLSCPKKSPKTKPMASSTPDAVGPKNMRRSLPVLPSPGKNTLSCNISPVTSKMGEDIGEKDNSKCKICTPSKSRSGSQLPKFSPMAGTKSSPNSPSRGQRRSEPLQSFLPRSLNPPKSPSIRVTEASSSPLNNSNKLGSKVKPLNLISKLRRRSASVAEKENYA